MYIRSDWKINFDDLKKFERTVKDANEENAIFKEAIEKQLLKEEKIQQSLKERLKLALNDLKMEDIQSVLLDTLLVERSMIDRAYDKYVKSL